MTTSRSAPSMSTQGAALGVAVAMLLTYGYEIFNFNLSLDEPVFVGAGQRSMAGLFAEQGRWGMALQYLVLPETIIPTVAAGLAVLLIAGSLWMFATRTLGLSPLAAGLVTSVAATLPTIGFAVSFATIAVGVGLGFAAVALFAIFATSWAPRRLLVALGLGTLALGIYQAFAFALLAVAIALTARAPDWRTARKHAAILVGCLGANAITSAVAKVALGAGTNAYVSDLMDLGGLARDPVARIAGAVEQNWAVLAPGASLFDKLQPWLALGVIVLVVLAARTSLRCPPGTSRLITVACVVALVAIPLAAALIVTELPVRSMVYLPFCLIALTAIAAGGPSDQDKSSTAPHVAGIVWAGVGVCILAVIANASVTNRAYVAADAALTQDRFLAMRINEELGRLFPNETDPVPIVISAPNVRELSTVGMATEQFGLSLFSGESWRATSFLTSQGVRVAFPSGEEESFGLEAIQEIPEYPRAGWARNVDGVLVVNLGPDD